MKNNMLFKEKHIVLRDNKFDLVGQNHFSAH
jgi:hypothetical protein